MKTTLPRQDFQDALTAVATLTGGRTTRPILSCVRLHAEGNQIRLSSTDGEASVQLSVPALKVDKAGEAVVPVERLLPIVREMVDVEVALEADEKFCVVRGKGSEFRIYVMNPADFPPMPDFDDEPDLVVDGGELHRMVELTLYAAARETSRYAINGVLWEKRGKHLFLIATDGRRLARAGGTLRESNSADFEAILPAKALGVFEKVFTGPADEPVQVRIMPNQVLLRAGDRLLSTVLVEGHFPKYDDVIPKEHNRVAQTPRDDLARAVRRTALLTTEESRAVRLEFGPEQLVITSQAPEQGDARVEMPIEFEGEPLAIGFNPHFLTDALRVMPYETVFLELLQTDRPGVLRGEDKNEFLYVVMPVSLSS